VEEALDTGLRVSLILQNLPGRLYLVLSRKGWTWGPPQGPVQADNPAAIAEAARRVTKSECGIEKIDRPRVLFRRPGVVRPDRVTKSYIVVHCIAQSPMGEPTDPSIAAVGSFATLAEVERIMRLSSAQKWALTMNGTQAARLFQGPPLCPRPVGVRIQHAFA
jgi:ADP-ribose pyrophosphatase YjhB (NUDIX family)